jgi:sugar/nucleoside kinase (ribokinase family)
VGHLILHNRAGNAVAGPTGTTERLPGPHCTSPVRSTGAGDRFNAGYLLGIALGLDDAARLDLGSAVSGAFLRKGTSPDLDAVVALLGDPTWPR